MGVSNVSSMLRSAQSLQNKQSTYNNDLAAYEWSNSAQTQDDYIKYETYLKSQQGKTSDPTKTLTYQKTIDSAFKSYTSNEIQRSSIAVLEGGGTLSDKQNTVGELYTSAVNNGDLNLATNLRQQYDTIDTEIQRQAQTAATAAQTLGIANANAQGADYRDSGLILEKGLADLTAEYKQGGSQAFNKALKDFVDQNAHTFEALGVKIPTDATTNIAQVTQGVITAIGQYNFLASQATAVSDPSASSKYKQDAVDIVTGAKTFSSPYGTHSLTYYTQVAQNPNLYVDTQDPTTGDYTLKKSTVSGYQMVNGQIQEVPANTTTTKGILTDNQYGQGITNKTSAEQQKQLTDLGFKVIGVDKTTGQIQVQLTGGNVKDANGKTVKITGSNDWIKPGQINKSNNAEFNIVPTDKGYQFTSVDASGGKHLYTIATDTNGRSGVLETNAKGASVPVHGQYGFNNSVNSVVQGSQTAALQAHQVALQKQIQLGQQQNQAALTSGGVKTTPLAGSFLASNPGAAPKAAPAAIPTTSGMPKTLTPTPIKTQSAYVAPSSIKPGTALTAAEMAQADAAIHSLLASGDTNLINTTRTAIQKSAGYGNPYDGYKLTLLDKQASNVSGGAALTSQSPVNLFKQ